MDELVNNQYALFTHTKTIPRPQARRKKGKKGKKRKSCYNSQKPIFKFLFIIILNSYYLSMDRLVIFVATILTLLCVSVVDSASFRIVNKCRRTIWPGFLSGANRAPLATTGFVLKSGKSRTISVPISWSGRMWGRTLCAEDNSGKFSCATGDCGSGKVECDGGNAEPPATLAEFTLNGDQGLDFYDVSLVDGYNLPMLVIARGGHGGDCSATGCLVDLNGACPAELRVATPATNGSHGASVACKSACEAFGDPMYCCSEAYSTPDTCQPSVYSQFFKHACPRAYSYAYDDKTSTFTCASADYIIIFCPSPFTSQKVLGLRREAAELPLVNKTTMYIGRKYASGALSPGRVQEQFIAHGVSVIVSLLLLLLFL